MANGNLWEPILWAKDRTFAAPAHPCARGIPSIPGHKKGPAKMPGLDFLLEASYF